MASGVAVGMQGVWAGEGEVEGEEWTRAIGEARWPVGSIRERGVTT